MEKQEQPSQEKRYQAYLLRIWQDQGKNTRRVSLKVIDSGEQYLFTNLESLFVFLHASALNERDEG